MHAKQPNLLHRPPRLSPHPSQRKPNLQLLSMPIASESNVGVPQHQLAKPQHQILRLKEQILFSPYIGAFYCHSRNLALHILSHRIH